MVEFEWRETRGEMSRTQTSVCTPADGKMFFPEPVKEEVMRLWTVGPVETSDRNSLALAAAGNLLCNYIDLESDRGAAFTSRPLIDSITRQL